MGPATHNGRPRMGPLTQNEPSASDWVIVLIFGIVDHIVNCLLNLCTDAPNWVNVLIRPIDNPNWVNVLIVPIDNPIACLVAQFGRDVQ